MPQDHYNASAVVSGASDPPFVGMELEFSGAGRYLWLNEEKFFGEARKAGKTER